MDRPFESAEVIEVVGVKKIYLNKFVERRLYGIEPSRRPRQGCGSRRWFTAEDVFGVALVWWLFESGLRSETVQYVLNQICGGHLKSSAKDAAAALRDKKAQILVIRREPRTVNEGASNHPAQKVFLEDLKGSVRRIERTETASLLVIPVGNLLSRLTNLMESK